MYIHLVKEALNSLNGNELIVFIITESPQERKLREQLEVDLLRSHSNTSLFGDDTDLQDQEQLLEAEEEEEFFSIASSRSIVIHKVCATST